VTSKPTKAHKATGKKVVKSRATSTRAKATRSQAATQKKTQSGKDAEVSKGAAGARPEIVLAPALDEPAVRLAQAFVTTLGAQHERAKRMVSVTVDADLWDEVARLVQEDAADTASAAVETALAMWAANQRLRELLDELYRDTPGAVPDKGQVAAAAELLGLR
jgi:hypothetical protein